GGPVLVTHPEMRRYFMTISEASQLVLQASAMGRGSQIYVLDMGSQVKIVDLARKLILLSGLVPDVDVKIEFIGVRPGEKLFEELNLDDETTVPTEHRKIKIFAGKEMSATGMQRMAERLEALCMNQQATEMMSLVEEMVPEYTPSEQILESLRAAPRANESAGTVRKQAASALPGTQAVAVGS
ncbi:MAG: polysaccharide biosynthesis protein, partial [Acidobacteriota bacterium]